MSLKILVADHSESISRAIHLSLEDFAVKVQSFIPDNLKDSQSKSLSLEENILKTVHSFKPSLIFLDTLLAKINGYEVAKTLKSDERFKSIPIILMYSSIMGIDQDKFQSSNADAILEKPFTQEKLRSVVTNCLKLESSPLGPIGEEIELPLIEDLKEDIIKQIQDSSSDTKNKFSKIPDKAQSQTLKQETAKTHQQPEGLISSDLELKELQKSLSELDGEEDFQQVSLFPSASSKSQKAIPQMTTPESNFTDQTPDFSSIDLTSTLSKKKKQEDPPKKHVTETAPKQDPLTSSHISSKIDSTVRDTSSIENKSKHIHLQEKPLEGKDSLKANMSATDKSSVSKASQDIQAQANTESSHGQPPGDAFRLNIFAEDVINDEVAVNVTEPEEEITKISFITTSQAQQAGKTDLEAMKKETTSHKKDIFKDTHQADIEQNKKQEITSQENMKKLIREEVRKIAQDQIQRTLNKELPDLAKKLIKAEITRLLSEYK